MRFWRRRPLMCRELVEVITDYLEGTMPARERARFEAHLAGCDACTAYVEQMRTTIRLTGRLDERDLDADTRTALMHAFHGWAGSG